MPRTIGILSPESNGPFIVIGSPIGSVGTQVEKNQVIMVLHGNKVAHEVVAPEHGIISHLLVEDGSVVQENSVLCLLEVSALREEETQNYALSDGTEVPVSKDQCIATIVSRPFSFHLENTYNCAKVRFCWEVTEHLIEYGIIAYLVDWDWQFVPDHYTKHDNELYYVFLDPSKISINILEEVLGNSSYDNVKTASLKQIVCRNPLHVGSDGKFRSQPSSIMATVAMAIGIQEMQIAEIVRVEGNL